MATTNLSDFRKGDTPTYVVRFTNHTAWQGDTVKFVMKENVDDASYAVEVSGTIIEDPEDAASSLVSLTVPKAQSEALTPYTSYFYEFEYRNAENTTILTLVPDKTEQLKSITILPELAVSA